MKNTNNFDITNEDALNFITGLEYLSDQLKQIDCPDFECNAYELLNDCTLTQTLRANIKPITTKDDHDSKRRKLKMKNYDKIPTLYRVYNVETGGVWELFAKDNLDAICQCSGGPESDPFTGPFRTEEMLTPEGYRITMLRLLPKGTYFNLVAARGKKPTPSRVYVRGEYDRSEAKYECCYFDDINHWRLLKGHTLVTLDMTF